MLVQEEVNSVEFMNESLSPAQANDLITGLVDKYINFYKLLYMSQWERDHSTSKEHFDMKVRQLNAKKEELKDMLYEARERGAEIEVDGLLNFKLAN